MSMRVGRMMAAWDGSMGERCAKEGVCRSIVGMEGHLSASPFYLGRACQEGYELNRTKI